MSYSLSFAEDFFTGTPDKEIGSDDLRNCYPVSERPQCVLQALISMEKFEPVEFRGMVKEVLGYRLNKNQSVDETVFWELLEAAKKYDTCDTLTPPVQVYLTPGYWVTVYNDIISIHA
jgi:hypothetical protein